MLLQFRPSLASGDKGAKARLGLAAAGSATYDLQMLSRRQMILGLSAFGIDFGSASCAARPFPERDFTDFETGQDGTAGPAFDRALDWVRREGGGRIRLPANRTLLLDREIRLPSNLALEGESGCVIVQTRPGLRLFVGDNVANVTLAGFAVRGAGPQELFLPERRTDPGGEAPRIVTDAGLIHVRSSVAGASRDLVFQDLTLSDGYNLLCIRGAHRVRIENCHFSNWMLFGALASGSSDVSAVGNRFTQCAQNRGYTAYAFSATGDERRGFPQTRLRFARNLVSGIPSWDGFMTHEVDQLIVEENEFHDVRNGIDVTTPSGRIANVRISQNRVFHTRSDPWRGRPAAHFGISVAADPGAPFIRNVTVAGNVIAGANAVPGLSAGGYAIGALAFSRIGELTVSDNLLKDVGNEDSRLPRPKGFDCINIYQAGSGIRILSNKGNGSLDRYFLELSGTEQGASNDITVAENAFTTSGAMESLIRFVRGTFRNVSISDNDLVSSNSNASEYQIKEDADVRLAPSSR